MTELSGTITQGVAEGIPPGIIRNGVCYTRFNIFQTESELIFTCNLPGVELRDLEIHSEDGELVLRGMVQPTPETARHLPKASTGNAFFSRRFTIDTPVDADKISARYRKGLLAIHIPKQDRGSQGEATLG
jgi:HSP20 family protein